ncbi:MAG: deoxyribose-phosphate aldolase [Gemmatimonadetes bacterium]|nr:deoxyribose-phosphate aldolase [Gemmatimonadota bacterium]
MGRYVDHTLLRATATSAEIVKLCREARAHAFAAVCVNPVWVELAAKELAGSGVAVASVIGFPLGANTTEVKVHEAKDALARGATELDMVAQIGKIKEGDWPGVERDIRAVVQAARGRALVKVILETAALEPMEIIKAAALSREAGADYVKTSSGFHPAGGATAEAVALLRLAVGAELGVKAAGGIRNCEDALRMIAAGATRLGTSAGIELVNCYGHLAPPIDAAVHRLGYRAPILSAVAY